MERLIPRPPVDELRNARALVFLDVDGVLNRLVDDELTDGHIVRKVVDESGRTFTFRVNLHLLDQLETQLRRPGVCWGWLTTWGTEELMARLHAANGPFAGRMRGGFIWGRPPFRPWMVSDWKLRAVQSVLAEVGTDKPIIWADDQLHSWANLNPKFRSQTGPRLLLQPHMAAGLHPETDVAQIAAFLDKHAAPPAG